MASNKGLVSTLAEMESFYKGDPLGQMIELMNQTNDILDDVQWMESNQSDGHLTRIRTGLPEVFWRRLYQGTPPSKSAWTQVKEGTGILEAIMELDIEEAKLYSNKAAAFRTTEGLAFTEAMRQKVSKTLMYGDSTKAPDEFNGLAMRYPSKVSPNVIDAQGNSANKQTSIWLISWGPNAVHGIYPKGSKGGLEHEDLGAYMTHDSDQRKYQVVGDKYNWKCGLTVRDWRACVRVCNVDSTKLALRKGEVGFIDLQGLLIKAKNMMPESMR
ncbi:MAG: hypothetical protein RRY29_10560, partial [Desulfovibrionaceae bacterium]